MKNSDLTARIHSIETCGTVDGPGLRYVAFFQGCPLRCKYCHNPDTWSTEKSCGTLMTVDEIVTDVIKYKSYMRFSSGGFTASGGEPLLQAKFLTELFKELKFWGIHTTLDTSGHTTKFSEVKELLNYTDLVLLDIKSIVPNKYHELTSADILPTLELAEYLNEQKIPAWIRYVVVPGLTDAASDADNLAKFLATLSNIKRVEIQPFHKMGEYKWDELGLTYDLKDTPVPTEEQMESVREIFRKRGINICL